jgi:uncharacterized membrane protein
MDAAVQTGQILFEASLRPHRSLTPRQVMVAGAAMAGASLFITALMYLLGAWPVIGFDTADIILALVLLWLNVRAARAVETIQLSEGAIAVMRVDAGGRREAFSLPAYWLKIELRERAGTVPTPTYNCGLSNTGLRIRCSPRRRAAVSSRFSVSPNDRAIS